MKKTEMKAATLLSLAARLSNYLKRIRCLQIFSGRFLSDEMCTK